MRRLAATLTLLVAVTAGCGGGKHQIQLQLSDLPSSTSCNNEGISTSEARAGTCVAGSTKITVANRGEQLQMEDYAVSVLGVRTTEHIGRRAAPNFTPDGKFVIVSLQITNTGSSPQSFDTNSDIAYLLVGGTEYGEVPQAEDLLPGSLKKDGSSIKPGDAGSGTVVFDPPASGANDLGSTGSYIVFLETNETTNGYPRLGFRSIGFIRLWK